ncbi:ribonuclease H-like domain-containing protein [Mycena galopus ATCC 62051]|nr:ribonuclease H-like domain-containing protein [Mycena galopus ATCC 62051]
MSRAALAGYFHNLHELQNASHYFNYCKGCVLHQKKLLQDAGTYDETEWQAEGQSFIDACHAAGSIRGDKGPWITHILGGKGTTACTHVTDAARQEARVHKNIEDAKKTGKQSGLPVVAGGATLLAEASTSQKHGRSMSSSALDVPGPKRLKQGFFQVFTGKDQPFSPAETEEIQAQVLRATISAGMPFRVWENPEVLRLIGMFRSAGPAIIPSRKVVGGRLLNEAAGKVEVEVNLALQGREIGLVSDGWKSRKKANVNGLCANTYTLELVDATAIGKDGPTLCKLFGDMIDRVELKHRCYVIFFGTDADGGSKKGRVLLGKQRPWLFVPSCWAHQFQLILGDYFKVYPYAAEISEQATGLIGWINNHGKVRVIFDNAQRELSPDRVGRILILAYLVANLTRWTTHCIAFLRLLILQEYLQFAVLRDRGAIIAAQVGAAQYTEATNLREEAEYYCDLIRSPEFWNGLSSVVSDIEPICYGTNINQKDSTRADQVLLTLAGLYLHFVNHPEPELSKGLVARIEKRWKDCDQPLYLVGLLLHPFEGASAFGPRANLDPFRIVALVVEVYIRVNSFPGNTDTPAQRQVKERTVSKSTFEYLSSTGGFQNWADARDEYEQLMGRDPIAVWTALSGGPDGELANFALTILRVVVNQAGCERLFSHVKETESPRRSRLALCKMEKIAKVSASIKADHLAEGIPVQVREKRKNHKSVAKLLAVPRYRDLIEDQDHADDGTRGSNLVSSRIQWRVEMNKWISDTRAAEFEDEDTDGEEEPNLALNPARAPPKIKNWTKTTLAVLFGGVVKKPVVKLTKVDINREAELMEALAEAEEDARLDDGAMAGSGDEYEP